MRRILKTVAFSSMGIILLVLIGASFVEKAVSSEAAYRWCYAAPWTIALWALAVLAGVAYLVMQRKALRWPAMLLHASFVVILSGAMITHLFGIQGAVELPAASPGQPAQPVTSFTDKYHDYRTLVFPFSVSLDDFTLLTYSGTDTPRDYVSTIRIQDGQKSVSGQVSMNHIFSYRHYRFYQSAYTQGKGGAASVVLLVNRDPVGIAVTYTGYALLLLAVLAFFFVPGTRFRRLLDEVRSPYPPSPVSSKHSYLTSFERSEGALDVSPSQNVATLSKGKGIMLAALLIMSARGMKANAGNPSAIPAESADRFGDLCVFYNGRIQPLSCLAADFTEKISGKDSWRGLSASQVYTGWLLFPYTWADEPMFKVKPADRRALGISSRYATYNQLLVASSQHAALTPYATEKIALIQMLLNGELSRIYPIDQDPLRLADKASQGRETECADANDSSPCGGQEGSLSWYSQGSDLPLGMPDDLWFFVKKSMDYAGELAVERNWAALDTVVTKIGRYQEKTLAAAGEEVSRPRFRAEQTLRRINYSTPLAIAMITFGLLLFVLYLARTSRGLTLPRWSRIAAVVVLALVWLFLTAMLALRWYVSGHVPLSNGHETMQALAWFAILIALISPLAGAHSSLNTPNSSLPYASLIAGLALMVSMMNGSNPQITSLMPVLQSPLLSIHVAVIMMAYVLFFFIALHSLSALLRGDGRKALKDDPEVRRRMALSGVLLYPAVFLLAVGIFLGAMWANVSWGTYWSWDPKEVWALITLLVYAAPIHAVSLPAFRKPLVWHLYCLLAFLSVLVTYFGVNFFLGGMHSYA